MEAKHDFTTGSIPKKLITFMFPIFCSLVLQAMYSAVDLLIVGKFGTTAGISGVANGANILMTVTNVVFALTTGVTVLIARNIGDKRTDKNGQLVGSAVFFFLCLSVVLSIVMIVFARQLALMLSTPEEALPLTVQYLRICGAGLVFVVFYNLISGIFRGMGNSNLPLLFVGIACVVNMVGDYILVAVLKMNVAGAAIATIGAQAVSVLISLFVIAKQKDLPFDFKLSYICFDRDVIDIIKLGTPLALQNFLTGFSFLAITTFVNRFGLTASSGYGIAQKITSFVMLIPSSIMQSMASFVSQNVGAGREDRAKSAMKTGMVFGVSIGALIFLFAFFKGDLLAKIFTDDQEVIIRAFEYLRGFAPEAVLTCIMFSFLGYFNGHAKSLFVMLQGLAASFLVRLPLSYYMSIRPDANLTGIALAVPIATVFGIVINVIYYIYMNKNELS